MKKIITYIIQKLVVKKVKNHQKMNSRLTKNNLPRKFVSISIEALTLNINKKKSVIFKNEGIIKSKRLSIMILNVVNYYIVTLIYFASCNLWLIVFWGNDFLLYLDRYIGYLGYFCNITILILAHSHLLWL